MTNTGDTIWHPGTCTLSTGTAHTLLPEMAPGGQFTAEFGFALPPPADEVTASVRRWNCEHLIGAASAAIEEYAPPVVIPPVVCGYLVRKGDTYEAIARVTLGSEAKAALIRAANPGVTTLTPGHFVAIPWPAGEYRYVVPKGGTFWAAARAAYGKANATNVARIIAWNGGNPNRGLKPGDVLRCPR